MKAKPTRLYSYMRHRRKLLEHLHDLRTELWVRFGSQKDRCDDEKLYDACFTVAMGDRDHAWELFLWRDLERGFAWNGDARALEIEESST